MRAFDLSAPSLPFSVPYWRRSVAARLPNPHGMAIFSREQPNARPRLSSTLPSHTLIRVFACTILHETRPDATTSERALLSTPRASGRRDSLLHRARPARASRQSLWSKFCRLLELAPISLTSNRSATLSATRLELPSCPLLRSKVSVLIDTFGCISGLHSRRRVAPLGSIFATIGKSDGAFQLLARL